MIPWRRDRLPMPVFLDFPCGSAGKESACNVGDLSSIPGLGRSPGEWEWLPTPVFWPGEFHGLYSPWRRRQWHPTPVLLPGKSMDGEAWKAAVHGVAEGRARLSDFTFTFHFHDWRRKWHPTPVFLPGESQGWGSLVGCRLWSRTESDTIEAT